MSARREARRRTDAAPRTTVVPVELRAGACLEVWGPHDRWKARRRWREARDAWLMARGIHPYWCDVRDTPEVLRGGGRMWSYDFLRLNNLERLASALAFRELPADWTPVYVESYDYGPPLVPDPMTWEEFTVWRDRRG